MPLVAKVLSLILLSTIRIGRIDVTRACKGFFNSITQTIQQKFEHLLRLELGSVNFRTESHCTKTPQIIMDTENNGKLFYDKWTKTLNQAKKDGEPADF